MPTKQETFDAVVAHLRKQGCKAKNEDADMCSYRTASGLKCAAGCLIPDDKYDRKMEGRPARPGEIAGDLIRSLGHDTALVCELQYLHDGGWVEEWEKGFADIARMFDLTYTPPEAAHA